MRHLAWLLLVTITLWGCTHSPNSEFKLPQQEAISGLGYPIALQYDSTELYLTDYFLEPNQIDSIYPVEGLSLVRLDERRLLLVGTAKDPLDNLSIWYKGVRYDIPVKRSEKKQIVFSFDPKEKEYETVALSGSMNGWAAAKNPLVWMNGEWVTTLTLNPGEYQYQLELDGEKTLDPSNPDKIDNGNGGFNSVLRVGNYKVEPPKLFTQKQEKDKIFITNQGVEEVLVYFDNHLLPSSFVTLTPEMISITLPPVIQQQERGVLRVFGYNENTLSNDLYIPLFKGKVIEDTDQLSRSDKHAYIMYFMMIDRFVNGDTLNDQKVDDPEIHPKANYYGGDLAGVSQTIDEAYFNQLGTNTIWLSPITQNPLGAYGYWDKGGVTSKFSGYHGYWPISSSKVDFRFGDDQTLKTLIDKAHKNGHNVLVDYVANHVHEEHPVYQQHPDWATDLYLPDGTMNTEKWDEHRLTTWFDTFMPTLNFFKPEVIEAMTDSALFWFENYPIDGFRHDATKHIPEEFWRTLTYKLKKRIVLPKNRGIYQIGETYGNEELISSYVNVGQLDGQFDFNVYDAAVAAFAQDDFPTSRLADKLKASLKYYGNHNLMGYISGNQDRPRFISYADGSLEFGEDTKLAGWTREIEIQDTTAYKNLIQLHAFNMTIPGIPVIYYGDEFGMPGGNDPDNRRWMRFGDNLSAAEKRTLNTVSTLAKTRLNHLALVYGDIAILQASDNLLVYARKFFDSEVVVVFNTSKEPKQLTLDKPKFLQSDTWNPTLSQTQLSFGKPLEMPGLSVEIFTNKRS